MLLHSPRFGINISFFIARLNVHGHSQVKIVVAFSSRRTTYFGLVLRFIFLVVCVHTPLGRCRRQADNTYRGKVNPRKNKQEKVHLPDSFKRISKAFVSKSSALPSSSKPIILRMVIQRRTEGEGGHEGNEPIFRNAVDEYNYARKDFNGQLFD